MTITIEATKAYEKEKTGVGWYTYYIVEQLLKVPSMEINFVFYLNPCIKSQISNLKSQKENKKLKILRLHWPARYFWTQLRLSLEMMIHPPDVLFIPAHLPPLVHPKRLVITVHDLAFKEYPNVYSKKELWLQEWGIRRVLKKAWRIITPSEFTKNEIVKYYPWADANKIFVVPHGVKKISAKGGPASGWQNFHSRSKTLLYIGRLEHKKNIINLIKAFNLLKKNYSLLTTHYSLILAGSPGFGYAAIRREIATSPYKAAIQELGYLPHEEINDLLQTCSVFVFPSLYEGFGMPLLEACAQGVPVACSDIMPFHEVGGDVPLYFNPHDPHDIAEKIHTLLNDKSLAQKKSALGVARAHGYTWRRAAQKTLEVLTIS